MTRNQEIATTIRSQLYTMDTHAMMCFGVNQFLAVENGLQFRASGSKVKRGGRVEIKLNGKDLYDVEVFRVVKFEKKVIKRVEDVYVEDLMHNLWDILG